MDVQLTPFQYWILGGIGSAFTAWLGYHIGRYGRRADRYWKAADEFRGAALAALVKIPKEPPSFWPHVQPGNPFEQLEQELKLASDKFWPYVRGRARRRSFAAKTHEALDACRRACKRGGNMPGTHMIPRWQLDSSYRTTCEIVRKAVYELIAQAPDEHLVKRFTMT
jgi:hypothetical protein